jgi:hypothetical protein
MSVNSSWVCEKYLSSCQGKNANRERDCLAIRKEWSALIGCVGGVGVIAYPCCPVGCRDLSLDKDSSLSSALAPPSLFRLVVSSLLCVQNTCYNYPVFILTP